MPNQLLQPTGHSLRSPLLAEARLGGFRGVKDERPQKDADSANDSKPQYRRDGVLSHEHTRFRLHNGGRAEVVTQSRRLGLCGDGGESPAGGPT